MKITARTLRSWLINICIFLLLVSPSIVITYYSYSNLHKELTDKTFSDRRTLSNQMALIVKSRLDDIRDVGISTAGNIVPLAKKDDWNGAIKQIEHISKEFPYIDRIFLSDLKGRTVAYYPPSPENVNKDFSFRDWYKGVSKNWEPYVSEVFKRAPYPQFNTVAVMSPIKDEKGVVYGAVGFAVNLDSFYALSKDFTVDKGGFLYIVNQKGQIVAHPKYDPQGPIIDFSNVPAVQEVMRGKSDVKIAYNPIDKEERLAAYTFIPEYNWGVVVTDPVTTAFVERDTFLASLRPVYGAILAVNIVFAFVVLLMLAQLRRSKEVLRKGNERLKELEKMKDEFVAIASHELRTPMTAVKWIVSVLLEGEYGKVPKYLQEPLSEIGTATDRLIALVNDLLDMTRIEAGRTKFTIVDTPIGKIIQNITQLLIPMLKQKNVTIKTESIPEILVQGDVDKIQQIINNILGNAIKFTDAGTIAISVKQEGDLAKVFVTDSGIGISQENQKKLFSKFQQVSSQKDGRPAGTGLGLYISRELARKMGGDLWIEKSEEGKGTVVGFSIPIAKSEKAATIKKDIEQEASTHPDQK